MYDSWSVFPKSVSSLVEYTRPINFLDCGYRSVRVEYFAMKAPSHNFHLQWITPRSFAFHTIPSTSFLLPTFSPLSYPVSDNTITLNSTFVLTPWLDTALLSSYSYRFSSDFLPNGVTLDPLTGALQGVMDQGNQLIGLRVTLTAWNEANTLHLTAPFFFHVLNSPASLAVSPIDEYLPPILQYHSSDIIVSEISVKTLDSILLIPTSFSVATRRFTITPALPSGLTLDPYTGTIEGRPFSALARTSFTVTLTTLDASWNCVLSIEVKQLAQGVVFYGTITGNRSAFFLTEDRIQPVNQWEEVVADRNGAFFFEVMKDVFWLQVERDW